MGVSVLIRDLTRVLRFSRESARAGFQQIGHISPTHVIEKAFE
jgi:hypothetical protein